MKYFHPGIHLVITAAMIGLAIGCSETKVSLLITYPLIGVAASLGLWLFVRILNALSD